VTRGAIREQFRDEEFERYHVLLVRKPRYRIPVFGQIAPLASYPVFGADIEGIIPIVRVGRWRTFEGDVLRAHFGERWLEVLADEVRRPYLRIDGEDASGRRYRLPVDVADQKARSVESPKAGRRSGLGLNVLIRHMRDIEGIKDYHALLAMCERSELPWATEATRATGVDPRDQVAVLRKAYSNGKARHIEACPYCANGLPEPWRGLIGNYK